jgi:hypothetical protein
MAEILPLQVDLRPLQSLRKPLGIIEGGRSSHILPQVIVKLLSEAPIAPDAKVSLLQLVEGSHERLRGKATAIDPEVAVF